MLSERLMSARCVHARTPHLHLHLHLPLQVQRGPHLIVMTFLMNRTRPSFSNLTQNNLKWDTYMSDVWPQSLTKSDFDGNNLADPEYGAGEGPKTAVFRPMTKKPQMMDEFCTWTPKLMNKYEVSSFNGVKTACGPLQSGPPQGWRLFSLKLLTSHVNKQAKRSKLGCERCKSSGRVGYLVLILIFVLCLWNTFYIFCTYKTPLVFFRQILVSLSHSHSKNLIGNLCT